jgi:hypothetical protein
MTTTSHKAEVGALAKSARHLLFDVEPPTSCTPQETLDKLIEAYELVGAAIVAARYALYE